MVNKFIDVTTKGGMEATVEVEVVLEQADYGVRGSPVWLEMVEWDYLGIEVEGVDYNVTQFKRIHGDAAFSELTNAVDKKLDDVDWFYEDFYSDDDNYYEE